MLLYLLYLEQSFYITLEEGEDEQSLLDMKFQDVSARAACFSVLNYNPDTNGGIVSLILWEAREAKDFGSREMIGPLEAEKAEELAREMALEEEEMEEQRKEMEQLHSLLEERKKDLLHELEQARAQKRALEEELQAAVKQLQVSLNDRRQQLEKQLAEAMTHLQDANATMGGDTACPWQVP